jgi:hypothetical protein
MRCSNGGTGTYHFKRLSLEGYGVGSYRQRSMSFTYGLTFDELSLTSSCLPAKLEHNAKRWRLSISPAAPRRPINRQSKTQPGR